MGLIKVLNYAINKNLHINMLRVHVRKTDSDTSYISVSKRCNNKIVQVNNRKIPENSNSRSLVNKTFL